jgi:hypothetical protein
VTSFFTYCVRGKHGPRHRVVVVLTRKGRVGLVASTGIGHEANHIHPGSLASRLRGHARSLGRGLWVRRVGSTRFVYLTRARSRASGRRGHAGGGGEAVDAARLHAPRPAALRTERPRLGQ